jgi:hypothetical protein
MASSPGICGAPLKAAREHRPGVRPSLSPASGAPRETIMTRCTKSYLLLPLLALCLTLAVSAQAATSASLQVTFGNAPHWTGIRGTRVSEMRDSERPGYDMFRYGGSYYAYNNEHWYKSRTVRGNYAIVEDRNVPREFSKVPRAHWKSYPAAWGDRNGNGNNNNGRGDGRSH